jgi:hypothetical protein
VKGLRNAKILAIPLSPTVLHYEPNCFFEYQLQPSYKIMVIIPLLPAACFPLASGQAPPIQVLLENLQEI